MTVISPANGPLVGGQSVTVTGTNFTINTTSVTIGGLAAIECGGHQSDDTHRKNPGTCRRSGGCRGLDAERPRSATVTLSTPTELSQS